MSVNASYLSAIAQRVVVFDGATGSNLQTRNLTADDFGGASLEGCNEHLVLTRPDVIRDLHDSFLRVGVDAIETNTFGAFRVPLGEYDIADKTHEINVAAARIAREVASSYATADRPRWVAGSIGPGTKFAVARPDPLRRAARPVRGAVRRAHRGRCGPVPHRDAVRPARHRRQPCRAHGGR